MGIKIESIVAGIVGADPTAGDVATGLCAGGGLVKFGRRRQGCVACPAVDDLGVAVCSVWFRADLSSLVGASLVDAVVAGVGRGDIRSMVHRFGFKPVGLGMKRVLKKRE